MTYFEQAGMTALHVACMKGHKEVVDNLLSHRDCRVLDNVGVNKEAKVQFAIRA